MNAVNVTKDGIQRILEEDDKRWEQYANSLAVSESTARRRRYYPLYLPKPGEAFLSGPFFAGVDPAGLVKRNAELEARNRELYKKLVHTENELAIAEEKLSVLSKSMTKAHSRRIPKNKGSRTIGRRVWREK